MKRPVRTAASPWTPTAPSRCRPRPWRPGTSCSACTTLRSRVAARWSSDGSTTGPSRSTEPVGGVTLERRLAQLETRLDKARQRELAELERFTRELLTDFRLPTDTLPADVAQVAALWRR